MERATITAFSGKRVVRRHEAVAGELVEQAVREFVEVVQAVAQVGVGLADQLGAGVALHPFHGGLGGEARHHRLAQAAQPAAVVGEHAERLQHLAVLAGPRHVALLDQAVDGQAQRRDGLLQPGDLGVEVLGDELRHHHAGLVQHGVAEPDALHDRDAPERQRLAQHGRAGHHGLELARRDHLRHQHGGGLEGLDLLLGIKPPRLVLHHQHAERVAGPQDRHAEEGQVDLFPGLGLVGEGGMVLGVGQRQGLGRGGDEADEALALPHGRLVDGFPVQPLGGVELEAAVRVEHIDRAHLGHHVEGDLDDDLVEARLGRDRLRHDLAQPAQQQSRSGQSATHRPLPSRPSVAGRPAPRRLPRPVTPTL